VNTSSAGYAMIEIIIDLHNVAEKEISVMVETFRQILYKLTTPQ